MRNRGFARPAVIIGLMIALLGALAGALLPSFAGVSATAQDEGSGLVDATSYESPQFGYTLGWDDAWSVRERDITSNEGGFDTITIRHDAGTVRVSGRADDYPAIEFLNDTVDLITSNADASEILSEELDGEIPFVEFTADRDHVIVEAHSLPEHGAVVVLTLRARESEFETALAAAREGVVLNDEPILQGGQGSSPAGTPAETPEAATPQASNEGIEGDTYTSPTYGYRLTWDANIWEAESRVGADGYNELRLESPSVSLAIWSGPFYNGDPAACLEGESDHFATDDPSVSDWEPAEDANGEPIGGETAVAAYGVFTLTYSDPETEDAEPVELVDYIECRSLVEGESVLVIFATTTPERYNDSIEDVLRISNAIELAGDDAATPASATDPAATPVTVTPDAVIPETPMPDTGTPAGTPEAITGLDGMTFTSPGFGFSITIPSTWSVADETIAEDEEILVLNNGTSVVTLQATSQYRGDLEGCVAYAQRQAAADPAYVDLAPDVTSTGAPLSGSNAEGAYANFTYTGSKSAKYAHFISCRAIVEGESYLILTQDVPYSDYPTQRQARRQIENAIVLPYAIGNEPGSAHIRGASFSAGSPAVVLGGRS